MWLHYQPKEWQVYCKSLLHRRTSVFCYLSARVSENEFGSFKKTKNSACNNWSKILRPNLPEKLSGEHFEKKPSKTVITYNYMSMPNYSLFSEFQIVGPNLANRKNDESFTK